MKSTFIAFTVTLLVAVLCLATTTYADTRSPALTPRQIFNTIDKNLDNSITKLEAEQYLKKLGAPNELLPKIIKEIFDKEDEDKNGVITYQEWVKVNAPIIENHNNNADQPTATATTPATNNMRTMSLATTLAAPDHHFVQVLTRFANASAAHDEHDDEYDDNDDEYDDGEDYFWLNFEDDKKFCTPEKKLEDLCWYRVYEHTNEKGEHEYFYACIEDDETDETQCYSVKIEEVEDE